MKKPIDIDNMIMMELVCNKNRLKLAWFCITGRAISVGYLINPFLDNNTAQPKTKQGGDDETGSILWRI